MNCFKSAVAFSFCFSFTELQLETVSKAFHITVGRLYVRCQSLTKILNNRKMEHQKKNIEYKDFTGNDVKPLVSRSLNELKELQKFCSAKMARYIGSPFYRERWHRHWYRIDMMMKDIESIPEDCD